jgi:hypothetical protein
VADLQLDVPARVGQHLTASGFSAQHVEAMRCRFEVLQRRPVCMLRAIQLTNVMVRLGVHTGEKLERAVNMQRRRAHPAFGVAN